MLAVNNAPGSDANVYKGSALAAPNCELNRSILVRHSALRQCELVSLFSDILVPFIFVFFLVFVTIPLLFSIPLRLSFLFFLAFLSFVLILFV